LVKSEEKTLAVVAKFESWMDGTVTQLDENKTITAFIPKKYFDYSRKNTY
jgi:hypothetical protein